MVWRWSLIIYQQDFHRDPEHGRHMLPIPYASEPLVSQQTLAGWGMSGQTLSPNTFLEHQNTKADKSCNNPGPAVTACPGPIAAQGKMRCFYPPRLICRGFFLPVRRMNAKQAMPELPLRWWVLLLICRWAEQGGWGRSPGSTPRSACCTFPQMASRLARSLRSLASRQQTNKSGLIKKENKLLNNVKGSHYGQCYLNQFFFFVVPKAQDIHKWVPFGDITEMYSRHEFMGVHQFLAIWFAEHRKLNLNIISVPSCFAVTLGIFPNPI